MKFVKKNMKMRMTIVLVLWSLLITYTINAQERLMPIPLRTVNSLNYWQDYSPARNGVVSLPFADDFSDINRTQTLWDLKGVYINNSLSMGAPTYGVASFDGLNDKMKPYSETYNAWGGADTMTIKPIDLSAFSPADSIVISFYVQRKGMGNDPSIEDSLILEGLTKDGKWTPLWRSSSSIDSSRFTWVAIKLEDSIFFHNNAQFRFRNTATISGFFDHWHIDWFYIDDNRSISDSTILDVAVQDVPISITSPYTRMPWHFLQAQPTYLQQPTITISNLSNAVRNTQYRFRLLAGNPAQVIDSSLFVATNLSPGTAKFSMTFNKFPTAITSVPDTGLTVQMQYIITAGGNSFTFNDTVTKTYVFDAMLGYDDGTPELAYGVEGQGSAFAYEFSIPNADTLWAIAILFVDQIRRNEEPDLFSVVVWEDIFTGQMLARKDFQMPCQIDSGWRFCIYRFDEPVIVPSKFYVGWIQTSANAMSVGFDKNTNARSRAWFNTMDTWENSQFKGTVMIRPIIGTFKQAEKYLALISETQQPQPNKSQIKAIPISNNSYMLQAPSEGNWQLFDLSGSLIMTFENKNNFILSLPYKGIFILKWESQSNQETIRLIGY